MLYLFEVLPQSVAVVDGAPNGSTIGTGAAAKKRDTGLDGGRREGVSKGGVGVYDGSDTSGLPLPLSIFRIPIDTHLRSL